MFAIPNLVSTEIFRCVPWEFTDRAAVPPRALTDKAFRTHWMQQPSTKYQAYSLFEGLNAGLRLKGPSSADEGNPPKWMYGFAADYDLKLSAEEVHMAIARMPEHLRPTYYEVSLSGNARLVWLFEKPILLHSYE